MSLTSSLFSGVSGLSTLGNSMQIIGDNIANVNTIGFKASNYLFQDLLSQSVATQSGTSQVGRGTALGDVSANYEQGSFESTGNTTDLGIGGDGFFILREPNSERVFYSRAGAFSLDQDGFLVNNEGYVVQGWALDEDGENMGSVSDIQLSSFTSPPEESGQVTIISNLDADAESATNWLANAWDTANEPPLDATNYEYQATVKVYDSLGSSHDVTIYYDKASDTDPFWEYIVTCNPSEDARSFITGPADSNAGLLARGRISFSDSSGTILPDGFTMETLSGAGDHNQEASNLSFVGAASNFTTANTTVNISDYNALTYSDTGITLDRDADGVWSLSGMDATGDYAAATIVPEPLDVAQTAASLPANALSDTYTFTVTSGGTVGTDLLTMNWYTTANPTGGAFTVPLSGNRTVDGMTLHFDAGNLSTGDTFTMTTDAAGAATVASVPGDSGFSISLDGTATSASECEMSIDFATPISGAGSVTFDISGASNWTAQAPNTNGYYEFTPDFIGADDGSTIMGIEFDIGSIWDGSGWQNDSLTTTQFARSSSTTYQSADGYGAGDFQGVDVDVDGVITGVYDNGQTIPLNRVALAKFLNEQELYKEGGGLYRETRSSGEAITGAPGTTGLGSISPNSLEQSNVDIANEFVKMISAQRGFQANSKIITTVDSMLQEVISMKR